MTVSTKLPPFVSYIPAKKARKCASASSVTSLYAEENSEIKILRRMIVVKIFHLEIGVINTCKPSHV